MEANPLFRMHNPMRGMRHQGGFMKTGENQFQLARIVIDVTNGEDGWSRGFKALGIHWNEIFLKVEAEIGNRSELHG